MDSSTSLRPLVMWAGGKTRLLGRYEAAWPEGQFDFYAEPFLGGGAVFAWLQRHGRSHPVSVLGDVNAELIGLYRAVREEVGSLVLEAGGLAREYLELELGDRKPWYYELRASYWKHPTPPRLLVLLKLGFNGIWQTCRASNGLYGTPAGLLRHTRLEQIVDEALLTRWAAALGGVGLHAGSYETLELPTGRGLIYLDPPYRDSFTTYGTGFDDVAQLNIVEWSLQRADAGHTVVLANRCVEGDSFFEDAFAGRARFTYFDVTYTAGRRRREAGGYSAKSAREFIAVVSAT